MQFSTGFSQNYTKDFLTIALSKSPQVRYPRASCDHINCTAHEKRTVGLPLKSTASSDMNVCQDSFKATPVKFAH